MTEHLPKQSPAGKSKRALAADGRMYFSYAQIHETVSKAVPAIQAFRPDVILAIGGGGYIPARMLRTEVRVPILAISLELYDDATKTANAQVIRRQWFDETGTGAKVPGGRVLIVDEVDDTRTTLQYAVEELRKDHAPAAIATFVVHNKDKPKKGVLPPDVTMIVGEEIPGWWACYPWDAAAYGHTVREHEALAKQCALEHDDKRPEAGAEAEHPAIFGGHVSSVAAMQYALIGLATMANIMMCKRNFQLR